MQNQSYTRYLDRTSKLAFRPSCLALSLLLASVTLYPMNTHIFQRISPDQHAVIVLVESMLATCLVAATAIAAYGAKHTAWSGFGKNTLMASAAIYAASFCATYVLVSSYSMADFILIVLSVLQGLSLLPLLILWTRRFTMEFRSVLFYGALICLAVTAIDWLLSVASPQAIVIIEPACAIFGAFAPLFIEEAPNPSAAYDVSGDSPATSASAIPEEVWRSLRNLLSVVGIPLIGFLMYLLFAGIYTFSLDGVTTSEYISGALASILALAIALPRHSSPLVILIEKLVIPTLVALCLAFGSFPSGTPVFFLGAFTANVPLMFFALFALAVFVSVTATGEFSLPFVFGMVFALCSAVLLLATMIMSESMGDANLGELLWTVLCIYFALIVFNLGYTSWKQMATHNEQDSDLPATDTPPHIASTKEESDRFYQESIEMLVQANGLTAREWEILGYLGRGYSSTFISKTLFISTSTVRTHIRHIYDKLGINSKEELFAAVDHPQMSGSRRILH